jgi:hypothetical protein
MRPSIVLASLLSLSAPLLVGSTAVAQDVNPYGRIDPIEASASVLRRAVGRDATPGALTALDKANPPGIERLLELLLDHPDPGVRTIAALKSAARGADPIRLHARLGDPAARAAFVLGLLGDDLLTADLAAALLDTEALDDWPIAQAIAAGRAGTPSALTRLAAIEENPDLPAAARGMAAGILESGTPGHVGRWLTTLDELPIEIRERVLFETSSMLERLDATEGLVALAAVMGDRPPDDAIRAGVVLGLLRLSPKDGMAAWSALARESGPDRAIPSAMLLLSAEREVPDSVLRDLPADDALQKAVHAVLAARPTDRPAAAIEAVRLGHLPTIRWLLELPRGKVPPEVLDEVIEAGLVHRRGGMIDVMLAAADELAAIDPQRLARRLASEQKDEAAREILLRGLITAATPETATAAEAYLTARERKTRSLALLASATGGRLDGNAVRRLGQAAAGGGGLPEDLRPLAAWHHLTLEDRLNDVLPTLLTP